MSVPVSNYTAVSEARAQRAAEAYRAAERLGRPHRQATEWRRLCKADQARRDFYGFADLLDRKDDVEDAEFEPLDDFETADQEIRSAYFMGAIAVGSACLLLGGLFIL
ncbi:hypothetical protein OB03_07395 [Brevundimonas sp. GN22]|uniref:hypothetical protein n=1 Tax=Brevundimonas pishanensis TaxID=2896315 RepID=UPI001FA7282D|nr:hypothetical protein [Brevundimonas pishanensis]